MSFWDALRISLSLIDTIPLLMRAGGGSIRIMACTTVLLPLPDSPTSPNISPEYTSNVTSRTAFTGTALEI